MIFTVGLVLAVAGWAVQLYQTASKKDRTISPFLPILYAVACILFLIDSLLAQNVTTGVLNTILIILSTISFIMLLTRAKAG